MNKLVMMLAAVLVSAILVGAGSSLMPDDLAKRQETRALLIMGLEKFQTGYATFRGANRVGPAVGTWEDDLDDYGGVPQPVNGWTWSYSTSVSGDYICLTGTAENAEWYGVLREAAGTFNVRESHFPDSYNVLLRSVVKNRLNRYFLAGAGGCGSTSESLAATFPAAFTVTFWASK